MIMVFDIETIPNEDDQEVFDYFLEKSINSLKNKGYNDDEIIKLAKEDVIFRTSINPFGGKVISIGIKIPGTKTKVISIWNNEWSEKKVIDKFWEINNVLYNSDKRLPLWVTKNGKRFDVPYIITRSSVNGCKVPDWFNAGQYLRLYSTYPHFDIDDVLFSGNRQNSVTLSVLAKIYDSPIKTKKEGGDVYSFYKEKQFEKIDKHCFEDVEATYHIYNRIKDYFK